MSWSSIRSKIAVSCTTDCGAFGACIILCPIRSHTCLLDSMDSIRSVCWPINYSYILRTWVRAVCKIRSNLICIRCDIWYKYLVSVLFRCQSTSCTTQRSVRLLIRIPPDHYWTTIISTKFYKITDSHSFTMVSSHLFAFICRNCKSGFIWECFLYPMS